MKRPTEYLFERQARRARWEACGRLRRRRVYRPAPERYVAPRELIRAPEKIDLVRGSAGHVCRFISAVADRVLRQGKPVKLDFRHTQKFYAAGTLLLFAELHRVVQSSTHPKPITVIDPHRRLPREVLKQIGVYKLTGDKCDVVPQHRDVVFWRAIYGADMSGDQLAPLDEIVDTVNQGQGSKLRVDSLWRGVSEAVANSVEHAYKHPRQDGFSGLPGQRWWMFTQLRDGVFIAAVCDLGCGYKRTIHATIPAAFVNEVFATLSGTNADSRAIQTAMAYGRSSTDQEHRGKGSRDALSILRQHGAGELLISSNTGWVSYKLRQGQDLEVSTGEYQIDTRATIVWWKLPLQGEIGG